LLLLLLLTIISLVSSQQLVGYLSFEDSYCTINPTTGDLSSCFKLPFNHIPGGSSFFHDNIFYTLVANYTDPYESTILLAIDVPKQEISWSVNLTDINEKDFPKDRSNLALSYSFQNNMIVLDSANYHVYLFNSTYHSYFPAGSYSQTSYCGAVDQITQNFWLMLSNTDLIVNLDSQKTSTFNPGWNIQSITYDSVSGHFFGLTNAAQNTLMYKWDSNGNVLNVGLIPNANMLYQASTTINTSARVLTFFSSTIGQQVQSLVTVSLDNATVISQPLIPYYLINFAYSQ